MAILFLVIVSYQIRKGQINPDRQLITKVIISSKIQLLSDIKTAVNAELAPTSSTFDVGYDFGYIHITIPQKSTH